MRNTDVTTDSAHACIACSGESRPFCTVPAHLDPTQTTTSGFGDVGYLQCCSCGSIWQHPLPTETELVNRVRSSYAIDEPRVESESRLTDNTAAHHHTMVSVLKRFGVREGVLEVGTGNGNMCAYMLEEGIECNGIDLSASLVAIAQRRGLPVTQGHLADQPADPARSAIVMSNVFEHLSDPIRALTQIHTLLRPGGLFLSDQPTAELTNLLSRVFRLNRVRVTSHFGLAYLNLNQWHIVLYSVRGMVTLASRHGFELIEVIPMPSLACEGWLGAARKVFQRVNMFGERLAPGRWPLHANRLFVFRRV